MLAGMNVAAGPKLAAAVTNAGGIGVLGGIGYTPDMLREQIAELKGYLNDQKAVFGVDLLLPQVGGSARKTKYVTATFLAYARVANDNTATTTPRAS
jgi:NAD(P)H-dependent flavin oxidoreductase YrpB (nitropropane dioxygenase family)